MGASRIDRHGNAFSRRMITTNQASLVFLTIVLFVGCRSVLGYSGGAPEVVCLSMQPGHGADVQTSPNPYKIILSKTSVSGHEMVNITLTSKNGHDQFKGFMIQVRKTSWWRIDGDKAVGKFIHDSLSEDAQTINCGKEPNTTVTHTHGNLKNTVTVQWIAPNDEDAYYEVYFTVVGMDPQTYWVKHHHEEKIRVRTNPDMVEPLEPRTKPDMVEPLEPRPGQKTMSSALRDSLSKVYQGCKSTKGCFGIPNGCIGKYLDDPNSEDPVLCEIMVTWTKMGKKGKFQLTGKPESHSKSSKGYVALGLSEDPVMGRDSVVGCILSPAKPGAVEIYRYHNPEKYNAAYENPTEGLTGISSSFVDGHIFCEFEQSSHNINDIEFNLENYYYFLLSKSPTASKEALGHHTRIEDRGYSDRAFNIGEMNV